MYTLDFFPIVFSIILDSSYFQIDVFFVSTNYNIFHWLPNILLIHQEKKSSMALNHCKKCKKDTNNAATEIFCNILSDEWIVSLVNIQFSKSLTLKLRWDVKFTFKGQTGSENLNKCSKELYIRKIM